MVSTGTSALVGLLQHADDAWLEHLLRQRSDLARPVPSSLTTLATRAASRASTSRAIAALTSPENAALEAVVVLTESGRPPTADDVGAALGIDVREVVDRLRSLALLLDGTTLVAAPGVVEAIGPNPLALGPTLRSLGVPQDAGWPTTASALRARLATAPNGARALLDALAAGPAVGTLGTTVPPAARWLLEHHVLHRLSATEVVLPREVGVAARAGRLAPQLSAAPPIGDAAVRAAGVVVSEAVSHAEGLLRDIGVLVALWREQAPGVLRAGGLAARDVKTLATALGSTPEHATLVAELAAMVGLIGQLQHEDGSTWGVSVAGSTWHEQPAATRWAALATAWLGSRRVPWIAGTRTERGVLRPALDPDLHRSWAPSVRRRTLAAVALWPTDAAPSAEQVREVLHWHTPRSAPPVATVAAVLAEATALGLLGADALAPTGAALLADVPRDALAAALTDIVGPEVGDLIIQGDLTGIVPGRPTPELTALLERAADIDSRGAALTVRFTSASVARALASGLSAAALLDALRAASLSGVPQPLEYLVTDVARRHRRVRVQPASTVVVVDDEAAVLALLSDPALADLGLRQTGSTTLAADASPLTVHEALRRAGTAPVLEGPDGRSVPPLPDRTRAARPVALEGPPTEAPGDLAAAVATMRAGEERAAQLLAGTGPEPSAVDDLDLLRTACAQGAQVRLVVAGAAGVTQERVVRPLSVDAGRVRALDAAREAEITVATHRIVAVRPV